MVSIGCKILLVEVLLAMSQFAGITHSKGWDRAHRALRQKTIQRRKRILLFHSHIEYLWPSPACLLILAVNGYPIVKCVPKRCRDLDLLFQKKLHFSMDQEEMKGTIPTSNFD